MMNADYNMSTLQQRKQALIDELGYIEDPQERLGYLVDIVRDVPGIDGEYKIDTFKIEGCVAQLWMVPRFDDGRCYFAVDSDGMISKAVAYAVADTFSRCKPEEIVGDSPDFLGEVGITQHLSPNRRNGLSNVWAKIKAYAEHCLSSAN